MSEKKAPREFWIRERDGHFENGAVNEAEVLVDSIHVVEASALTDCEAKLEEAKGFIETHDMQIRVLTKQLEEYAKEAEIINELHVENERLRGLQKDHETDWKRIQDAERECERLKEELEERRMATPTMNAVHMLQAQLRDYETALEFYAKEKHIHIEAEWEMEAHFPGEVARLALSKHKAAGEKE